MENVQRLVEILQELRLASLSMQSTLQTESEIKAAMKKYDMLFLGGNFNFINTVELHHSVKNVFNWNIEKDEFLKLVPAACESLEIKYEVAVLANEPNTFAGYFITLT
ncbi:hypothetical protein [Ectobacillus ponti]|uniref:Uncharacterized protein n=1 Tax=Ectobacillus ponti TaxID=2961894 RepID=A0AA41XAE7_9BACI|nr:hypothetical protein [Ectobacillus ponti]MCP8969694.1 hypothetical protein [Ectobacillus ponti]